MIVDQEDNIVYSPPDFIRMNIPGREPVIELCNQFNELGRYDIQSIMNFETRFNPKVKKYGERFNKS